MKTYLFILISVLSYSMQSSALGEIALTFDDSPMKNGYLYTGIERTNKIIQTLKKYKIQTAFFSNSSRLNEDFGRGRLNLYSQAGHIIANHTHSHPRLAHTSLDDYIYDFNQAHNLLRSYPTFKKWFRFPYLNEGRTIVKRDGFRKFLRSQDYINGYVTIDNYDYYIDHLVQKSLKNGRSINYERACLMLKNILWEGISFYDDLAKKYIGDVRHVLLMHENDIEALCLEELILAIQNKGWKIVSPEYAFADPKMQKEPETLYLSQGRVAAIIHEKTGLKFKSKWENTKALTEEYKHRQIEIQQR